MSVYVYLVHVVYMCVNVLYEVIVMYLCVLK
jgi:hypothetical protein